MITNQATSKRSNNGTRYQRTNYDVKRTPSGRRGLRMGIEFEFEISVQNLMVVGRHRRSAMYM